MTGGGGGFKDWQELRTHLIDTYGETPRPETEAVIIEAYERHPNQLERSALALTADVAAGTIRSGWAVLRSRAGSISAPPSNPTRNTSVDREKRIMRAEEWIRAAGIHIDRDTEIQDELFNERGQLRDYPDLTDHMLHLWAEERPRGLQTERAAEERAEKWKTTQASLNAKPRTEDQPL